MKKMKRLKKGSKIAIVTPSNGLAYHFPELFEKGLENLRTQFGFEVVVMPHARKSIQELYENPKLRADDINDAFRDESIDGIICTIGGYESVRILKYLDKETISSNPKMIMGFSDSTSFLTYINQMGLITLYGPSVLAGLAQLENLPKTHLKHMRDILFEDVYPYEYKPYDLYSQKYKDWNNPNTLGEIEEEFENKNGHQWLQGQGITSGTLWGGCIEVLETLKGTEYWPEVDFFSDKVLFLESSEEKPSPMQFGYMLRNYGTQNILRRIKGLIIGRPKDYSEEEKIELKEIILNIINFENDLKELPIIMNFDFGHTDPKLLMPLGGQVPLDCFDKRIVLDESPFE